jgi:carboxymethylenebutenolidase
MKTEMIEAHGVPAYWAQPEGEGPFPTVLVFFEAFGLNEHIRDVARRLAREGYVAIAPDFYHRLPEPRIAAYGDMERVAALASATPDEHIVEDVRAVLAHAKASPVVRTDRIGAIGFCMGGRMSVLAACHFPEEIRAVASFYGGGIASPRRFGPAGTPPLQLADRLRARMRLFFGGRDPFIPPQEVRTIEARLTELGKDAEVFIYPDAEHGFFCDERASYHAQAAQDAWQKTLELFQEVLKR